MMVEKEYIIEDYTDPCPLPPEYCDEESEDSYTPRTKPSYETILRMIKELIKNYRQQNI